MKIITSTAAAALAASGLFVPPAAMGAPPAAAGAQVFTRSCAMCHTTAPGAPARLGPNLASVANRKAASTPAFRYSPAMTKSGLTWNAKTLDGFLERPSVAVPGNRMGFAGVKDPAQRAALVAFLMGLPK